MKTINEEKEVKMFSLLLPMADFKLLEIIKKNKRFTTTQQAVRFLLYNRITILDFMDNAETITMSVNYSSNEKDINN